MLPNFYDLFEPERPFYCKVSRESKGGAEILNKFLNAEDSFRNYHFLLGLGRILASNLEASYEPYH